MSITSSKIIDIIGVITRTMVIEIEQFYPSTIAKHHRLTIIRSELIDNIILPNFGSKK